MMLPISLAACQVTCIWQERSSCSEYQVVLQISGAMLTAIPCTAATGLQQVEMCPRVFPSSAYAS